jgi:hypothetical protein
VTSTSSSQLPLFHIVGFCGHRRIETWPKCSEFIAGAVDALRREVAGEWLALSSAAVGSDLLFVQHVLGAGLAWQAVLPLPPAEFQRDFAADRLAQGRGPAGPG